MSSARSAKLQQDRRFFGANAVVLAVATFIGFAPTYYLAGVTHAPAIGLLVSIHGAVFTAWMLLYVSQTALIAADRADLHRAAGIAGGALAVAVVVLGVATAIYSARTGGGAPHRNQPVFLIFPLTNILLFGALCLAGIRYRQRADYHKRLMLLATTALVVTPLARISKMTGMGFSPPAIGGMLLGDLILAGLLVFDLRQRGRLHPATTVAGGAFLLSEPLRAGIGHSAPWLTFARWLIG